MCSNMILLQAHLPDISGWSPGFLWPRHVICYGIYLPYAGIHIEQDHIFWGTCKGYESDYEQSGGNHSFKIINNEKTAEAFVDGKKVFESGKDLKIITDLSGNLLYIKQFTADADVKSIKTIKISLKKTKSPVSFNHRRLLYTYIMKRTNVIYLISHNLKKCLSNGNR